MNFGKEQTLKTDAKLMPEIRYKINPDRTKPWNELPDLPIAESLYRNLPVFEQLVLAKEALGKLQGRSIAISNPALLINSISLQEAKASSEIENIFTTDDELYKSYSETMDEPPQGPVKEVLRYKEALWKGYETVKRDGGFSQAYFIETMQEIKQVDEGMRPPFAQTIILQGGTGPNAGKTVYTPPRGSKILEEKMENLCRFINDDGAYPLDPVLKMAIGHFQFEAIHPFRDGNGRTGRIFCIHVLTQKGILDMPILYLSRYILSHKIDYYKVLEGVSQRGNWEAYLIFMLTAIHHTANLTYEKINRILAAKEAIQAEIIKQANFKNPEQLVQMIFNQPFSKVKHFTEKGVYAENTARDYLNRLCTMGVLEKKNIQGHFYYFNTELGTILGD